MVALLTLQGNFLFACLLDNYSTSKARPQISHLEDKKDRMKGPAVEQAEERGGTKVRKRKGLLKI